MPVRFTAPPLTSLKNGKATLSVQVVVSILDQKFGSIGEGFSIPYEATYAPPVLDRVIVEYRTIDGQKLIELIAEGSNFGTVPVNLNSGGQSYKICNQPGTPKENCSIVPVSKSWSDTEIVFRINSLGETDFPGTLQIFVGDAKTVQRRYTRESPEIYFNSTAANQKFFVIAIPHSWWASFQSSDSQHRKHPGSLKVYFGDPDDQGSMATLISPLNKVEGPEPEDNVWNGTFMSPLGQGLSVPVVAQFDEAVSKPIFVNFRRPEIFFIRHGGTTLTRGESILATPPGIPTEGALLTIHGRNLGRLGSVFFCITLPPSRDDPEAAETEIVECTEGAAK